jgi:hypothetical protein
MCAREEYQEPFSKEGQQKEYWNSFIQTCVAQCHHPPLMDNGGEYTSKEFVNICKDVGIKIPNKTV